ncbi:amidohydrolase family protein [Bradyrhizobium sp. RDI18]|uniref:amidohydrolase family protein n=1 Tax=Bradyrhizobium sp. RDI18 TaxID=3367400 RepID=UPI0037205A63
MRSRQSDQAGGIDPHSHIGGGKMTIARMMLPEDHMHDTVARTDLTRAGVGHAVPSTMLTGYRYAEMGYTAAFEPAMLPANARQAHMEMADTSIIDKGAFVMLGSDDLFLRQLAGKKDFSAIKDYIAWTMHAAQAIAVKVVNPGGISAFKFNQRKLDLNEKHVYYGVTPRDIIVTLARGLKNSASSILCTSTAAISVFRAAMKPLSRQSRAPKALPDPSHLHSVPQLWN